jgi:glutathione synthase/RimK-type ligase-like ATP-grasp enzyme
VTTSASRRRRRIGFVTFGELPGLTPDDRSALSAFSTLGIDVVPTVWTEPLPEGLDALVLRSTWDYHLRLGDFLAWVSAVEARGLPLWNPPETVRWNVDKAYLLEVARRGVPILPTRHAVRGSGVALPALLHEAGWEQAVVKPSISGGAFGTWRASASAEDAARFARQLEAMDCLVQPFAAELVSTGEWSLLFFGARYSHAVLKRPTAGDFRVQEEFGGMVQPVEAPPDIVAAATGALEAAGHETLYARVDGVIRKGRLELMELELVEPSLFLETSPGAAERFAAAVADVLG